MNINLYRKVFDKIRELFSKQYDIQDIYDFIDEHGTSNFLEYYEEYVKIGEEIGYGIVDAYIEKFGIEDVANCTNQYVGSYKDEESFTEEHYNDNYTIPVDLVIDWKQTWKINLSHSFVFCNGHVFSRD